MQKSKPYLNTIRSKHPTIAYDVSAYASGSKNSSDIVYTEYIQSIETIDLAIRTISNIISLCDMKLYRLDNKGVKKPHSIKNLDLEFPNETDSSVDFLRKLAVNVYSQGAGLIVTEEGKRGKASGKMINLYVLNVASIEAVSDGKKLISQFKYKAENGTDVYYKAEDCIYINDSIYKLNFLFLT